VQFQNPDDFIGYLKMDIDFGNIEYITICDIIHLFTEE
jgi:hypothetical protein